MVSIRTVSLAPTLLLGLPTAPALASTFEVDIEASRAIGTSCRTGESAFLTEGGSNRVALELGDFRVGIGAIDDATSARSTCAVALVGRLPRGFAIRAISHEGAYDVFKSSTPDLRFSAAVMGAGLRSDPVELAFPKGLSAYGTNEPFRLENELRNADALCAEGRGDEVTMTVVYAASAQRGSRYSYADFDLSPGRKVGIAFDVVRCR